MKTTSCAVNGDPSLNVTPSLSLKVQVRPSSLVSQLLQHLSGRADGRPTIILVQVLSLAFVACCVLFLRQTATEPRPEADVAGWLAPFLIFGAVAAFGTGLLAYLGSTHRSYELTTDLALTRGVGPRLAGHKAVVLAGSERWVPASLSAQLRSYVLGGGKVLSLGVDSLRRGVTVEGGKALDPTAPAASDVFGAHLGPVVSGSHSLLIVIRDRLGIFTTTSGAFAGFSSYQPISSVAPPADILSEAGVSYTEPSIVGYRLGRGTVVDIAIPGFGSRQTQASASSCGHTITSRKASDRSSSLFSSSTTTGSTRPRAISG